MMERIIILALKWTVILWILIKLAVVMSCRQETMLANEDMQPVVLLVFDQRWMKLDI